jgi:dTDP-4-amino-4,6-dideoxygalactose transaminase
LISVADPGRAVVAQRPELAAAIARVLDSGRYVLGPEHDAFESELATYLGVAHCVAVASGTDALELALRALECAPDGEVITAANAGCYASTAISRAGLRVSFADVDPTTLLLSVETVEPALSARTAAVVVTHLYGTLADVEPLVDLCHANGVAVVEDCAQAAGARRGARMAGSFGDLAAFSFYPTKNLAALGDGGAVATDDSALADRLRQLRQYGWRHKYEVVTDGGRNSRLDDVQAAILRTRLPRLDADNERRRAVVSAYSRALRPDVGRLVVRDAEDCVCHLAVALVENREAVRDAMRDAGVGTDVHYPVADHRQPCRADRFADLSLPVTEHATARVLTLPCHAELDDAEVELVCEALGAL